MNLLDRILTLFFKHEDIVNGGQLYLRRFVIRRNEEKGHLYLHHIYKSDDDRYPHDHPWAFDTFVLAGGYLNHEYPYKFIEAEPTRQRVDIRPNRVYNIIRARDPIVTAALVGHAYRRERLHCHLLKLHPGKTAWTLVRTRGQNRPWGFLTETTWQYWRSYLGDWRGM